jgi:hypothetical protein
MNWIADHVPLWLWVVLTLGGGGAIIAFVPGALALVVGIWNMMPKPVKIVLGATVGALALYLAGRNKGHADAVVEQEKRDERGEQQRQDIHRDIAKLPEKDVDRRLDKYMRD